MPDVVTTASAVSYRQAAPVTRVRPQLIATGPLGMTHSKLTEQKEENVQLRQSLAGVEQALSHRECELNQAQLDLAAKVQALGQLQMEKAMLEEQLRAKQENGSLDITTPRVNGNFQAREVGIEPSLELHRQLEGMASRLQEQEVQTAMQLDEQQRENALVLSQHQSLLTELEQQTEKSRVLRSDIQACELKDADNVGTICRLEALLAEKEDAVALLTEQNRQMQSSSAEAMANSAVATDLEAKIEYESIVCAGLQEELGKAKLQNDEYATTIAALSQAQAKAQEDVLEHAAQLKALREQASDRSVSPSHRDGASISPCAGSIVFRRQLSNASSEKLFEAVAKDSTTALVEILQQSDRAIELVLGTRNEEGRTLLHASLASGSMEAAKFLLTEGKEWATRRQFAYKLQGELLERELCEFVNSSDKDGFSPLAVLCRDKSSNNDVAVALIEAQADPLCRDPQGMTPFLECARAGNITLMKVLLQLTRGLVLLDSDQESRTALHWAAQEGREDAVQILLRARCDHEATDSEGRTPAEVAALASHPELGLLISGCDDADRASADDNHSEDEGADNTMGPDGPEAAFRCQDGNEGLVEDEMNGYANESGRMPMHPTSQPHLWPGPHAKDTPYPSDTPLRPENTVFA